MASTVVFVTLFTTVDASAKFVQFSVDIPTLIAYYSYALPGIVYQMIPVGCLTATIFTLSSLSRGNEMVAMFGTGMSLARISAPILFWVSFTSVCTFWINDRVGPYVTDKKNYVFYTKIKKKPHLYSTVKTDKIWYRSRDVLFHIQTLNPREKRAQGTSFYYFDNQWNLLQVIKASSATIEGDNWNLFDGSITLFAAETRVPLTQKFDQKTIVIDEKLDDLQVSQSTAALLSVAELKRFIQKNKEAGLNTLDYEV